VRLLPGDVPWADFTAAGVVPIERGVLPQFYWIPVGLVAPLC
jgi:hypothetical protein